VSLRNPGAPALSVVTPLFNCLAFTQAMVASLRASIPSRISYEIILVDDGSTDGTREWLAGLGSPFRVLLNERNLGFGASSNRGAAVARGRVLAFLNNDLILAKGWLGPMLWALRLMGPKAGFVGNVQLNAASGTVDHAGIFVNLKGKPEHDRRPPSLLRRIVAPRKAVAAATGACLLIRATTWRRLGGFDETYVNGCEDVDACLRARTLGLWNVVALRSRVLHHVSSSPGRKLRDEENTRRLVRRWRHELAVLASREWTWVTFCPVVPEPRDFPDTAEALRMAAYMAHLRWSPSPSAIAGMGLAIDAELARWEKMFSD
jgi:O-antigen biosynthesis protein